MKRVLLPASVFILLLVLSACGAGAQTAPQVSDRGSHLQSHSVQAIIAQRERAAGREAEQLLRRVALPRGATRTQRLSGYGGVLLCCGSTPAAEVVDRSRFWSVHGSFAAAVSFVRRHRLPGFTDNGGGQSSGKNTPPNDELSFSAGHTRYLNVAIVKLPTRLVIRVDALVVWIYPRSPAEKVPPAVRRIGVKTTTVSREVTDPAKVKKIVDWFDALPISPPGVALFCPAYRLIPVTFSFRSATGKLLAEAVVPAGGAGICDAITFDIHGKRQTPLIDSQHGPSFAARVERLLDVRFPDGK